MGASPLSQLEMVKDAGAQSLGLMSGYSWEADPKRLGFTAARYKFVAKMLEGKRSVLEVGCADAFFSRIVKQHVGTLVAVDVNREYIGSAKKVRSAKWPIFLNDWNILEGPLRPAGRFEAVYALDVFEHIPKEKEELFLTNMALCASVCIIGTPSAESQQWASEISKLEHVNCPTKESLRASMEQHWKQVFMFGMNDEVLHAGHMPAYLFGLGVNAASA